MYFWVKSFRLQYKQTKNTHIKNKYFDFYMSPHSKTRILNVRKSTIHIKKCSKQERKSFLRQNLFLKIYIYTNGQRKATTEA